MYNGDLDYCSVMVIPSLLQKKGPVINNQSASPPDLFIFAVVRKYYVAIFLSLLFTLALVNAGFFAIHNSDTISSTNTKPNSYSSIDFNTSNSEIEISSNSGFATPQAHHVFQKLLGNLSSDTKRTYSRLNFSSPNSGSSDQLPIKAYLSQIYPSHNFW
jgi:hypothetical protein